MSALLYLAVGMTSSWVALYTRGLPPQLRDARRAEIDSDLWEQRQVAGLDDEPPGETAFELLARLLLGIPADLLWRLDAGRSTGNERIIAMNESWTMRGFVAAGVTVTLVVLLSGIGAVVDALVQGDSSSGQAGFGAISIVAGTAAAAGLLVSRRHPVLGIGLVAAGAITIAAAWYWMLPITVPVGLALVAIAYIRGRPARRAGAAPPPQAA